MRVAYFLIVFLLAASGCSGDGPSEPAVLQIGGQWSFSESYTDTSLSISCNNQAVVTLTQTGANFTGTSVQTGSCATPMGSIGNSGTFQLRTGLVAGSNVSWSDDGEPVCNYTGTITGTPPNRMSGTVRCNAVVGGVTYDFRGTWQLTR